MTSATLWLQGARPRTLGAAVAPVLVGTSAAVADADGVRGTDKERKGPVRLTATGLATPGAVKRAAFLSFGVAAVAGLVLSLMVDPWLLLVGVAAIAAAWVYTGGPKPYGYLGLGEVMVLVFFGFVATVGSAYVQVEYVPGASLVLRNVSFGDAMPLIVLPGVAMTLISVSAFGGSAIGAGSSRRMMPTSSCSSTGRKWLAIQRKM